MELLFLSIILGFLTVLLGTPVAEKYLFASGIYGKDQQKLGKPRIPTSGGVIVLLGFMFAISFYAGATALFTETVTDRSLIFAAVSSAALIALIGLIDDVHVDITRLVEERVGEDIQIDLETGKTIFHRHVDVVFGAKDSEIERTGLNQAVKMLMVLPAAFPLIAVGAGSWTMTFPVIGVIDWGLIYPLLLLPLGLLFVSNVVNMLAGINGMEAALAFVASTALGIHAYQNGAVEAYALTFVLSGTLLAFLFYNKYPATVLPGDSLTYLCGAVMFSAMVIGDMEKFGIILFMPWMAEFLLKARNKFNAHSWGEIQPDGTLKPLHSKNYSLTHPLMRRGLTEKQIAGVMTAAMSVWAIITLLAFSYAPYLSAV